MFFQRRAWNSSLFASVNCRRREARRQALGKLGEFSRLLGLILAKEYVFL